MILLQPRRAASCAPASVLVKYGDVPRFVSSTQYCLGVQILDRDRGVIVQREFVGRIRDHLDAGEDVRHLSVNRVDDVVARAGSESALKYQIIRILQSKTCGCGLHALIIDMWK